MYTALIILNIGLAFMNLPFALQGNLFNAFVIGFIVAVIGVLCLLSMGYLKWEL